MFRSILNNDIYQRCRQKGSDFLLTYGDALSWLGEKKDVRVYIIKSRYVDEWYYVLSTDLDRKKTFFSSWEKAADAGIKEALAYVS